MVHKTIPPFEKSNSRLKGVRAVLDENDQLLDKTKYTAAHNTNKVLRYLVETIARVEADLILLQNKLQPILREIQEDNDWRSRIPRDEHE